MESGIKAVLEAVKNNVIKHEIILNNLANINTTGFREQFFSLILDGKNNNISNEKECFLKPVVCYSGKPGSILNTNRLLDIAPLQNYWITLKNPSSQKEMFTRNGHMNIDSKRRLTINNFLVLGEKGIIKIPNYESLIFLEDGTIISVLKGKKKYLGRLKLSCLNSKYLKKNKYSFCYDLFKNVKNTLKKNFSNNEKKIRQKSLESSNVDVTKNLLDSIDCSRKFDFYTSIVEHDIENSNVLNKLIDINS